MRAMNVDGRLALVVGDGLVDVESASGSRFAADPQLAYEHWEALRAWAGTLSGDAVSIPVPTDGVGAPTPRPSQVFAIGLNYADHVAEGNIQLPTSPSCFTKFPASIGGPFDLVELPEGFVDYEAELVAVIGKRAYRVDAGDAWSYVAGLTVGQDLSERNMQTQGPAPQFSLGKSYKGFTPMGPVLVTPDEFTDPTDLGLTCRLNGEVMQHARTSSMVFSIADIIEYLSSVLPLLPGDVIFTGTPEGVGFVRDPKVQLKPGDVLETEIEEIGTIRQTFSDRD